MRHTTPTLRVRHSKKRPGVRAGHGALRLSCGQALSSVGIAQNLNVQRHLQHSSLMEPEYEYNIATQPKNDVNPQKDTLEKPMTETNRTCHPAGRRAGCRTGGRRETLTYPTRFLKQTDRSTIHMPQYTFPCCRSRIAESNAI